MAEVEFSGLRFQQPYFQSATATVAYFEKDTGIPTEQFYEFYEKIAASHLGMIIVEHAYVEPRGRASDHQLAIDRDEIIPYHRQLIERIKKVDPKIIVCSQLAHAGKIAVTPSPLDINTMTAEEAEELVEKFVEAAVRAQKAGYDCVQIHAAHGYLLSHSLSSYFNKRTDEFAYGTYYLLERIFTQIKDKKIIAGVKLQTDDFIEGSGMDAAQTCALLAKLRFDFVELSGGTSVGKHMTARPASGGSYYYRHVVAALKEKNLLGSQPILCTGGFENKAEAQEALDDGVRMVGFARKFLRNPTFLLNDDKKCVRCCRCHHNGGACIFK